MTELISHRFFIAPSSDFCVSIALMASTGFHQSNSTRGLYSTSKERGNIPHLDKFHHSKHRRVSTSTLTAHHQIKTQIVLEVTRMGFPWID